MQHFAWQCLDNRSRLYRRLARAVIITLRVFQQIRGYCTFKIYKEVNQVAGQFMVCKVKVAFNTWVK